LPFGGTLASAKRWLLLAEFITWQEPEVNYLSQLSANVVAPAKPVRLAFGSFYTKQQLGLTDEEADLKNQEKYYTQFFLGFSEYTSKAPFDSLITVRFCR
jgi:hypothetical protein